jgi:acetyl esterase
MTIPRRQVLRRTHEGGQLPGAPLNDSGGSKVSELDPIINRQFGWADAYPVETIMSDPTLAARMMSSYTDDPNYQPPSIHSYDTFIDGPLGEGSLRLRVYEPPAGKAEARQVLVWAHGGGFVGGTLDFQEADGVAREVCARGNIAVVSVDYHLVDGKIAYPTLHREMAAAFQWASQNTSDIAAENASVFLGGGSAGANLTMGATLELRDDGKTLPDGLVIVYPLLHVPVPAPAQQADLSKVPQVLRMSHEFAEWVIANYRGADPGLYTLIEGHDLHGLPPTLVIACEYDDLRGSADAFAEEARRAGVTVHEYLAQGVPHGHLAMTPAVAETDNTLNTITRFIRDETV